MPSDSMTPDVVTPTMAPSVFATMGQPCGSRWAKSEIEWLALAYVQALAKDGDMWKRLSRERVYELLSDDQRRYVHGMLTLEHDIYRWWFKIVSDQLVSAAGALDGVWRSA